MLQVLEKDLLWLTVMVYMVQGGVMAEKEAQRIQVMTHPYHQDSLIDLTILAVMEDKAAIMIMSIQVSNL